MGDALSQNGNELKLDDLRDPETAAGVLMRVSIEIEDVKREQARHGRMLEKICIALSIKPEKSDPPPKIREELQSLHDKDEKLEKADAETSQQIAAVTKEVAETRLDVRFGLIKGIPRLYKALIAVSVAIMAAVGLAAQVWEVLKHGW